MILSQASRILEYILKLNILKEIFWDSLLSILGKKKITHISVGLLVGSGFRLSFGGFVLLFQLICFFVLIYQWRKKKISLTTGMQDFQQKTFWTLIFIFSSFIYQKQERCFDWFPLHFQSNYWPNLTVISSVFSGENRAGMWISTYASPRLQQLPVWSIKPWQVMDQMKA